MHSVDIITMGCSKNLVDSEQLMWQFKKFGYKIYHNPERTHGDVEIGRASCRERV